MKHCSNVQGALDCAFRSYNWHLMFFKASGDSLSQRIGGCANHCVIRQSVLVVHRELEVLHICSTRHLHLLLLQVTSLSSLFNLGLLRKRLHAQFLSSFVPA